MHARTIRFSVFLAAGLAAFPAVPPGGAEVFPGAAPEDPSFYLTMNYVDDDYIYHAYEQAGYWVNSYTYNNGCIKLYGHDLSPAGTVSSESLLTNGPKYGISITVMKSNDEYLYVGTSGGDVVQIDKATLQRTGWCHLAGHRITGIVDRGDGYLYATTYFGPGPGICGPGNNQFHKIDPDGMAAVSGFWAPDSTHSLAGAGPHLFSTTCCYGYDPSLSWGDFQGPVEGGLVLVLDPATMKGHDVYFAGMEELGNDILLVGGRAYFMDVLDFFYRLDLSSRKIDKIVKIPGLYARRFFFSGNRIYAEDSAQTALGAPGYYRMEIQNPAAVEKLDSGKEVHSIFVHGRDLYISYGHEAAIEDINRKPVFAPSGPFTVKGYQHLEFAVEAHDADGDALAYGVKAGTLPPGASFNPQARLFSWTPSLLHASSSPYLVQFTAEDSWGGEAALSVRIYVTGQFDLSPTPAPKIAGMGKISVSRVPVPAPPPPVLMTVPVEALRDPFPPIPGPDPSPLR